MNRDHAQRWVDALANEEFGQAFGTLRDNSGDTVKFCALGLGSHLAGLDVSARWTRERLTEWLDVSDEDLEYIIYGVDDEHPNDRPRSLMVLNDDERMPFPEIAKILQERLDTVAAEG